LCRWLGYGQKEVELDGSINCKPLIDGLLMKKAISQKQKQVFHSVEPEAHLRQDCLPSIAVQDGTSSS
jgi:hypothetical protein